MGQYSTRDLIKKLPIVGPVLRYVYGMVVAPVRILKLSAANVQNEERARSLKVEQHAIMNKLEQLEEHLSNLSHRQTVVSQQLARIEKTKSQKTNTISSPSTSSSLLADNHALDNFYLEFENKFRGTEEEIENRLELYVPHIKKLSVDFKSFPLIDLGCGRGEMLRVMKKNQILAKGVDLNEAMVERSNELGYDVTLDNAIDYIEKQPENSVGAITAFHLVEHIPFDQLLRLFTACHRALVRNGVVIFETPNPENLRVGAWTFYMDPSHLHPLPPKLLEFALQTQGFAKTEILRIHPIKEFEEEQTDNKLMQEVKDRLLGPQDYSVIATKL